MTEARLRALLEELDRTLAERGPLDAESVRLLGEAKRDIEEALERRAPADVARSRLRQAVDRWRTEHPDGVIMLQQILDALTHVGL